MIKENSYRISLLPGIFSIVIAFLTGYFILFRLEVAIAICLFPFILWLSIIDKKNVLYIFFIIMPFVNTPYFSINLMGIPGAKLFNLLGVFTAVLFFFHGGNLFKSDDLIERKSLAVLFLYFVVFTFASFRTLGYLQRLNMLDPENFHSSPLRHLLSAYVMPSLYLIPFIYILKLIRTKTEIYKCINGICYSIFVLSCSVVVVGLLNINMITGGRNVTNEVFSSFFGLHYNAIGSMYICVAPLLVFQIIEKRKLAVANYILSVIAVCLLQSRSTIMVFVGGALLLLYFLRKRKFMLILLGVLGVSLFFWVPEFLLKTFQTGLDQGGFDSIFTGRIDSIWVPLIKERLNNINQLFWGVGRYSMMNSSLYMNRFILQSNSAHNAFIEFFIDNGIIIFSVFMICLVLYLKKAWIWAKKINSPLGWALFTCLITYLTGTISGRKIYPHQHNMYMFPIIALYINYIRINLDSKLRK